MNIFELIFTQPIFNVLFFLYAIIPGHDLGVAVILFTILVRLALWPIVKKQLHQSKLMRDIQPELQKIKQKAKGNRQLEGQLMLELYKERGINPFSSIGLLLIQLPFFIALYSSINILAVHKDDIDKFTYGFMQVIPHAKEVVADPNRFNEFFFGVFDLTKSALNAGSVWTTLLFGVIAFVTAIVQYKQSKQIMPAPKEKKRLRDIFKDQAAGKDVDQSEVMAVVQSRFMILFPVVMFIAAITVAGALELYLLTTTIVGYLQQQHVLGKDTEEMETIAEQPKSNAKRSIEQDKNDSSNTTEVTPVTPAKARKKTSRASRAKRAKVIASKQDKAS